MTYFRRSPISQAWPAWLVSSHGDYVTPNSGILLSLSVVIYYEKKILLFYSFGLYIRCFANVSINGVFLCYFSFIVDEHVKKIYEYLLVWLIFLHKHSLLRRLGIHDIYDITHKLQLHCIVVSFNLLQLSGADGWIDGWIDVLMDR